MIIKRATQKEAKELSTLEKELFSEANYPISYGSFYYHTKNNLLYVAQSEQRVVAYILLLIKRRDANIFSLGVSAPFRGQNISKKLLNTALTELHTLGFKKVNLEVRSDNLNAIALYEKSGFTVVKRVANFYRDGCDAYKMERRL